MELNKLRISSRAFEVPVELTIFGVRSCNQAITSLKDPIDLPLICARTCHAVEPKKLTQLRRRPCCEHPLSNRRCPVGVNGPVLLLGSVSSRFQAPHIFGSSREPTARWHRALGPFLRSRSHDAGGCCPSHCGRNAITDDPASSRRHRRRWYGWLHDLEGNTCRFH